MSKPANPVEITDNLPDQTIQRSNTDNAPRSAIHQTLYSADTFAQHDYLAGKNLPDIARPQEGQIDWLHLSASMMLPCSNTRLSLTASMSW